MLETIILKSCIGVGEDENMETPNDTTTTSPSQSEEELVIEGIKFTKEQQAVINKQIEAEKKKAQRALEEARALRAKADLTDSERREVDKRIEEMTNQLLSKEELSKREREKIIKNYEEKITELSKGVENWQNRFYETTINTELMNAAVANDAYNPEQLLAILRPRTALVEETDSDGNKTGKFKTLVKLMIKNDKGENLPLDLSPKEAVKKMAELDEYLNLFKSGGAGGIGGINRTNQSGSIDIAKIAKEDPLRYAQLRKEGKINF